MVGGSREDFFPCGGVGDGDFGYFLRCLPGRRIDIDLQVAVQLFPCGVGDGFIEVGEKFEE